MRITFRRILNLLLYLSSCVMVGTGLLMAYRLIPGSRGGQGLEVLGWNRHEWGALHTRVSYVFITLVAAHLAIFCSRSPSVRAEQAKARDILPR